MHAHTRTVCTQKGLSFPLPAELLCRSKLETGLNGKRMPVPLALVLFEAHWTPGVLRGPSSAWIKRSNLASFYSTISFLGVSPHLIVLSHLQQVNIWADRNKEQSRAAPFLSSIQAPAYRPGRA